MNKGMGSKILDSLPAIPDVGVIALVPDKFNDVWQVRHQVLTRLSKYFYIVWCDPAQSWRELRLFGGNHKMKSHHCWNTRDLPSFALYQPGKWLIGVERPAFLGRWTMRKRLRQAHHLLSSRGCRKIILYIWRPEFAASLDLIDHDLSCYHIDDEYTFSEKEKPISKSETRLISCVGQVYIHSPALLEKKGNLNTHTLVVPNGVDYNTYSVPRSEPHDLKKIPHPRIGYIGVIKKQLDFELLIALVRRHPQWSFVFVGPQGNLENCETLIEQLASFSNVYFLGRKEVSALPSYTQHLDVCLLCYAINDYTKYIYPLKLHEYLAGGKPIVGTPIRTLLDFAHVIKLASTPSEWSRAVTECLAPDEISIDLIEKRQSIARQFDWETIVHVIARSMCDRLGPPYKDQLSALRVA
jgi:glycosyltransferase involved in cell wall biosynthesis